MKKVIYNRNSNMTVLHSPISYDFISIYRIILNLLCILYNCNHRVQNTNHFVFCFYINVQFFIYLYTVFIVMTNNSLSVYYNLLIHPSIVDHLFSVFKGYYRFF